MIYDLSGKEKSALLGAAEIALGLMSEGVDTQPEPQPKLKYLGDIRPEVTPFPAPRPPQPKKKGPGTPGAPPGVSLLYYGRHKGDRSRQGVVTVAWIESSPGILRLAFSFCSPEDRWCKATGRNMALARLLHPLVIPFLYSPKRTVHEVVRAVLTHDFMRLATLSGGVTMWGRVPSWTKGLAKRLMGGTERERRGRGKALEIELPLTIIAHMMADITALGDAR